MYAWGKRRFLKDFEPSQKQTCLVSHVWECTQYDTLFIVCRHRWR